MSYKQLISEIKSNDIKKAYLIYGHENYLIDKAVENIKNTVVSAFPELNFTFFDGENLKAEQLLNACETFPFGSEKKLVLIKNFYLLKASKKETEEEDAAPRTGTEVQTFLDIISNIPDTTCLLFANYESIDKRKKLVNEIKKQGGMHEFERVERGDLSTWIKGLLEKSKKKINARDLDHFINLSGYIDKNGTKTLYDVENEVKKLISYMGKEEQVSTAYIDGMMPRNIENDIFKLINACSEKKISDCLSVYNDLLIEGESSMGILAMISKQIKNMMGVSELYAHGGDSRSISEKLKIHEYTVKLCIKYCSSINRTKLFSAFNKCLDSELNVKTGRMAERMAIEMLLVSLFE